MSDTIHDNVTTAVFPSGEVVRLDEKGLHVDGKLITTDAEKARVLMDIVVDYVWHNGGRVY